MPNLVENAGMIEEQARIYDTLRSGNERIFLLKRKSDTSKFIVVTEVTSGWHVGFNKFREMMGFSFATLDASFVDYFAAHSHVGYGLPDSDNEIDVFVIDERDKIPPGSGQYSYKCFGERLGNERFELFN
jgi:hypothetical protein